MRGQLLVSTTNFDQTSGDWIDIYINNVINKRLFLTSFNLYSCPLSIGDVVRIEVTDVSPLITSYLNLVRRDYTTDDEGGNNGIVDTNIVNNVSFTSYTFTATTVNPAYDFEYRMDISFSPAPTPSPTPNPTPTPTPAFCNFDIGTGFNNVVETLALQSDDKILVGGAFTSYSGTTRNRIIRLNSGGTIDTGFSIGTGADGIVEDIVIQSDNKILTAGRFSTYNGVTTGPLIRLNTNGSLDTNFNLPLNSYLNTAKIQSDGKILIGGAFTLYSATTYNRIIRLTSGGTIDSGFTIGTGFNDEVFDIEVQSDGKILVGGDFTSYSGVTSRRIIRLNTDGTVDTSFNVGTAFNSTVQKIAIQSDGKILVGGSFTTYTGTTYNRIIRLNSNGSVDTGFNIGTGCSSGVRNILINPDNTIFVVGNFSTYNGITSRRIVKLNSDGSYNNTFNVGSGFNTITPSITLGVSSIVVQSDNKIVAGGGFESFNGYSRNFIIKLNSDGTDDTC